MQIDLKVLTVVVLSASMLSTIGASQAATTEESLRQVDDLEERTIASFKKRDNMVEVKHNWDQEQAILKELPQNVRTAYAYARLGFDYRNFGNDQVLGHVLDLKAVEIYEREMGPEAPQLISIIERLAVDALHARNPKLSIELYTRALKITEKSFGEFDPRVAQLLDSLAERYRGEKNWTKASAAELRAIKIYEREAEASVLNIATSRDKLAKSLSGESKLDEAEKSYKTGIQNFSHTLGPNSLPVTTMLDSLADVYVREKRYGDAENALKESLAKKQQALGPKSEYLITTLNKYAEFLKSRGRDAEATEMRNRAGKIQALYPIEKRAGIGGY